MVQLLNLCPLEVDICINRGDTTPWTFTVRTGVPLAPLDISGFSYLLTVDPSATPTDALNNLFQLTGTIIDGPNGVVRFALSDSQADQVPKEYFFDLQQTDGSGARRSLIQGSFEFFQDITK